VYDSENLDFEATYQRLWEDSVNREIPPCGVHLTGAGRKIDRNAGSLSFRLFPSDINVMIFPKGPNHKVQVAWTDDREKEKYMPKLLDLLVPIKGQEKVVLRPLSVNILKVPYSDPPVKLTLAWCKEKVRYSRVVSGFAGWFFGDWVERRAERKETERQKRIEENDRGIRELDASFQAKKEFFYSSSDPKLREEFFEIKQKWRKRLGLIQE
jgi:hypothetical protein